MKRTLKLTVLLVTLVVLGFSAAMAAMPPNPNQDTLQTLGQLKGVVKDVQTGKVLPNAIIYLEGSRVNAMSNEAGRFIFRDVPCGTCKIRVERAGYEPVENEVNIRDKKCCPVKVKLKVKKSMAAPVLKSTIQQVS